MKTEEENNVKVQGKAKKVKKKYKQKDYKIMTTQAER